MKVKVLFIVCTCFLCCGMLLAQDDLSEMERLNARVSALEKTAEKLSKLKVTGFIQAQYQYAQWGADGYNFRLQNRLNSVESANNQGYGRFGLRRGRIKFTYEDGLMQAVYQPNLTQSGISIKDVYFAIKDPVFGTNQLKIGIFDRPFGHEIAYSSATNESNERSRIIQTLFPDESDMGFMVTLQPPKSSPLNILKMEGGLFAGNGVSPQISSRMDFIGRLSMTLPLEQGVVFGLGASGYFGGVLQNDESVYIMKDGFFQLREAPTKDNIIQYAKRQYIGVDAQLRMTTSLGSTNIRAEYITGEHPFPGGTNAKLTALRTGPVYMRQLSGGYVVFEQNVGHTPFTFVAKYDWLDPNTEIAGNDIAKAPSNNAQVKTGSGDIARWTTGFGLVWHIHPSTRLTAYYDIVKTETTENLKDVRNESSGKITVYGYENRRKENVFTLRLQYRF